MKYGFLKVSAGSPQIYLADPMKNAINIVKMAKECAQNGSKVLVTGELSLVGNTAQDILKNNSVQNICLEALNYIKNETIDDDILVTVGLPLMANAKLFNVVAVIKGGDILGFVPKTNLTTEDKRYFADGKYAPKAIQLDSNFVFINSYHIFTDTSYNSLKIGITIGEEFNELISNTTILRQNGASLILNSGSTVALVDNIDEKNNEISYYSKKLNMAYVSASTGDGESTTNVVMSGSCVICESGEILNKTSIFGLENVVTSEIDFNLEQKTCYNISEEITENFINFFGEETTLTRDFVENPFLPKENFSKAFDEIFTIQTKGLVQRMRHIGAKKAVVAVSGGLDSTLALLVAHKAVKELGLKADDLISITMPGFGTSGRTYNNALNLMKGLGSDIMEVPIKDAVLQHFKDINHDIADKSVVYENAQARERTQIGMDIANKVSGLFIGTGDLSELCLGFATYSGDHISMYGVNASLPKTLMQHIVRYLANSDDYTNVKDELLDILDTPISPELLPSEENGEMKQKTEDIIGPYELHDFFVYHFAYKNLAPSKVYHIAKYVFSGKYTPEDVYKWLHKFITRYYTQQFKRSCATDGIKVFEFSTSPRGDLLMPSDAMYTALITDLESVK